MKRDIVLTLYKQHIEDAHDFLVHRETCPMCEYAYREAYQYWTAKLEENLLPLIQEHEARWERDGVAIGNISSPGLDIVHEVLTHWVKLRPVVVDDAPETYFDHPVVQELYEKELAKK